MSAAGERADANGSGGPSFVGSGGCASRRLSRRNAGIFFSSPTGCVYLNINYTRCYHASPLCLGALTRAQGRQIGWNRVDAERVKSSRASQAFQPPASVGAFLIVTLAI
jgi:hypothetical protein